MAGNGTLDETLTSRQRRFVDALAITATVRGAAEKAAIGVFVTLEPATPDMKTEAVTAGHYHSTGWNQDYPRLQILTIEELLKGDQVRMPPTAQTFKQAPKADAGKEDQPKLKL